jgi:hypothetical protein
VNRVNIYRALGVTIFAVSLRRTLCLKKILPHEESTKHQARGRSLRKQKRMFAILTINLL